MGELRKSSAELVQRRCYPPLVGKCGGVPAGLQIGDGRLQRRRSGGSGSRRLEKGPAIHFKMVNFLIEPLLPVGQLRQLFPGRLAPHLPLDRMTGRRLCRDNFVHGLSKFAQQAGDARRRRRLKCFVSADQLLQLLLDFFLLVDRLWRMRIHG